nr:O-antigen ligase family protein [Methylosinus sp. Sm6]
MQLVQGQDSALRFYALTFRDVGVGFFANRNHTAAFLYATIPIAAFASDRFIRHGNHGVALLLGYLLTAWLGLMMTASRSALLMGFIATVGAAALLMRGRMGLLKQLRVADYLIAGGFLAGAGGLATSFGLSGILARLSEEKIAADARWSVAKASFSAAEAFFPFGSGLGAFDRVYPVFEGAAGIVPAFVNHAHNDVLELVVELGLVGLVVIIGAIVFAGLSAWRCLREGDATVATERSAALLVAILLFVHSLWDYPLRTSGVAAVFAFCGAVLCAIPRTERREAGRGGADKRSEQSRRRAFTDASGGVHAPSPALRWRMSAPRRSGS